MKTWITPKGTELKIMDIKGNDYMQVMWRLVWFRSEKPDWSIETDILIHNDKESFVKATIKTAEGKIVSTAHKYDRSDKPADIINRVEGTETGAIGRALGLLGYGTQFCGDELDERERLADSPVAKPNPHAPKNMQPEPGDGVQHPNPQYRIPFGKFAKKGFGEIPVNEIENYVGYLMNKAKLDNKPLQGQVFEFVQRAEAYIAECRAAGPMFPNDLN